jgi:hypothetical protein
MNWANPTVQHDRDLRAEYAHADGDWINQAPEGAVVHILGTLKTVTLRPRGGVPALEAELTDGSGCITVVWLGRRRIGGVTPGRQIRVHGRIGRVGRDQMIFNPRYELLP